MTARADTCVYLDEVPLVRVHESTNTNGRAILAMDAVLTIFAPVEVMRATLVAALAALPEEDR